MNGNTRRKRLQTGFEVRQFIRSDSDSESRVDLSQQETHYSQDHDIQSLSSIGCWSLMGVVVACLFSSRSANDEQSSLLKNQQQSRRHQVLSISHVYVHILSDLSIYYYCYCSCSFTITSHQWRKFSSRTYHEEVCPRLCFLLCH